MHPVLLAVGFFRVYTYGLFLVLGGLAFYLFLSSRRRSIGIEKTEDLLLLVVALFVGGFVGGRAGHLLLYVGTQAFLREAVAFSSGFSVLGAVAGLAAGAAWFSRRLKLDLPRLWDYVAQGGALDQFFGRLGCLAAGCCYGRPAPDTPWAVTFRDPRALVPPELLGRPLHPAQAYEALGDLAIAGGLYCFFLRPLERGRSRPGLLAAAYLFSYGALRFAMEFFRGDAVPSILPLLTGGQAASLLLMGAGLSLAAAVRSRRLGSGRILGKKGAQP